MRILRGRSGTGFSRAAGGKPLLRMLALSALPLFVVACASRPTSEILEPVDVPVVQPQRVFVATTRGIALQNGRKIFGDHRVETSRYAIFDFSIPPDHRAAEIEWPKENGTPDPAASFVVTGRQDTDRAGFLKTIRGTTSPTPDISLFVHGYNTSMPEAVFRTAQIGADAGADAANVVFVWPSSARLTSYVADRDAADFSRPALVTLISDLERTAGTGRIFVIGHSMGGRLVMEALVQLRLQGRADILNRIEVVLADPDIDVDLFWRQVGQVGKLPVPITVMTAPDDKALRVSSLLAGGRVRIGAVDVRDEATLARAKTHGVRLIDISDIDSDLIGHGRLMQIAEFYGRVPASRPGEGLRRAGAYIVTSLGQGMIGIGDAFAP